MNNNRITQDKDLNVLIQDRSFVQNTEKIAYSLSIVIPAYNEEKNLESAVLNTLDTLKDIGLNYEIIIVNDNSQDKTAQIAEDLAKREAKITCIHNDTNLGIGGAFRNGMELAGMNYVMLMPADNPLSVEDLKVYIPRMGICDIIVGKRIKRVGYTPFMKTYSFVYNRLLIPLLFNIGISDVNWIQIYRKKIFSKDGITIEYQGIFFLVEILIKARMKHLIVAEVPTSMKKRIYGKPTSSHMRIIWQTFSDMLKFFIQIHCKRKKYKT